ncbi:methylmalonyl-CoA epimerase [Oceanobacillus halophilus]|uniref:Methylmalonyl-CoA epimerase n=1 Tax=Oceanobacillus halophilus TaxID=930130 RepID=A0A495AD53_9BACI|nr:methylmalonyl-CoA epimerase [Oceanobacillus halophilus]RKQ37733.1 methylmalonyl-CoA epimerase [Oceanobacillus halophilus]
MGKKIRVLVAKPGLDGHDRGALVISQALRDHGMEVIYTGLRQSPLQIAQAAIQEDVDVIGLSSLSGAHKTLFPKVIEELEKRNASDIPVVGGGVIPSEDIPYLLEKGVKKIFTSGSSTDLLANYIQELIDPKTEPITPPKKVAHIGIAVESIDHSIPFYTDSLGLPLEAVEEVESEGVKVAFIKIGETRFELLEPLNEESPIRKFLNKNGEGIHHVALEVDDIQSRIEYLKTSGIQLINDKAKPGAHNSKVAFIHPKAAGRVLFELCEYPEEGGEA